MINNQEQPRVVLIFGEPLQGKSTLAERLQADYGYYLIDLDDLYLELVGTQYPELELPNLDNIIKGHHDQILINLDYEGGIA